MLVLVLPRTRLVLARRRCCCLVTLLAATAWWRWRQLDGDQSERLGLARLREVVHYGHYWRARPTSVVEMVEMVKMVKTVVDMV